MPRRDDGPDARRKFAPTEAPQGLKRVREVTTVQGQRPADEINPFSGESC